MVEEEGEEECFRCVWGSVKCGVEDFDSGEYWSKLRMVS